MMGAMNRPSDWRMPMVIMRIAAPATMIVRWRRSSPAGFSAVGDFIQSRDHRRRFGGAPETVHADFYCGVKPRFSEPAQLAALSDGISLARQHTTGAGEHLRRLHTRPLLRLPMQYLP